MGISQRQKDDRKEWIERLDRLIECTKLKHNDEDYMHPSELVELIYDIPHWDISEKDRNKYLEKLGIE